MMNQGNHITSLRNIWVGILSLSFLHSFSQQGAAPVSSFNTGYSVGVQMRNTPFLQVRGLDSILTDNPQDHAPVVQNFSLGYTLKIKSFWSVGTDVEFSWINRELNYGAGGKANWEVDTNANPWLDATKGYGYRIMGINVFTEFDLLWKLPDDAFLFKMGINTASVKRTDSYVAYFESTGDAYNALGEERFDFWLRPYFSLAWEEYLGQHFGYRLGITYYPKFHFTPYKLVVTEDIRQGKEFPNQVYSYSDKPEGINELPREKIDQRALNLNVSLLYRL